MSGKAERKVQEQDAEAIQNPDVSRNDYCWQMTQRKAAAEKEILEHKEEWIANGHGEYSTLKSTKDFYYAKMKSKNLVVHVYPIPAMYGEIADKYLSSIAAQHIETKFCKIDFELPQSSCDGLTINSSTILMYKDSKMIDYIINSDELGGVGSIEKLEYELSKSAIIFHFGEFYFSPENYEMRKFHNSLVEWIEEAMRDAMEDSDNISDMNKRVVKN